MYKIIAIAPTSYQLDSLRAFGLNINSRGSGSYFSEKEFNTEEEAKQYLVTRAEKYNDEDPNGSQERLDYMLKDISYGVLTLDGATARIEEVCKEEEL